MSALAYRALPSIEFSNPRSRDGVVRENPKGRLRVTHIGRSIRVKEADLCAFIEALSN